MSSKPASMQMAEIGEVTGLADGSALSVKPAAAAAKGAQSAPPLPASQPSERADSCKASAATSVGAASSKSLFSAVSKRPAEVRKPKLVLLQEKQTHTIHTCCLGLGIW